MLRHFLTLTFWHEKCAKLNSKNTLFAYAASSKEGQGNVG